MRLLVAKNLDRFSNDKKAGFSITNAFNQHLIMHKLDLIWKKKTKNIRKLDLGSKFIYGYFNFIAFTFFNILFDFSYIL